MGLTLLLLAACGDNSAPGASPTPLLPSSSSSIPSVRVISGADGAVVADARLKVNGVEVSLANGEHRSPAGVDLRGQPIDVEAPGYLPRLATVVSPHIELWPVASAADVQGVRDLVYESRLGSVRLFKNTTHLLIGTDGSVSTVAVQQFHSAARRVNLLNPESQIFFSGQGPPAGLSLEFYVRVDTAGEVCATQPPVGGICFFPDRGEAGSDTIVLAADAAERPDTALRVLARLHLAGLNHRPGLLNVQNPAPDLSPLEETALRMLAKRTLCNQWPDTDRGC